MILSINGLDKIVQYLKDIYNRYNHVQLPHGYYREISKRFVNMERVSFNFWKPDLDYISSVKIEISDKTDEILCFANEKFFLYLGHKNAKITVFFYI